MAQFQEVFFHSVFKTTKKVSFSSENWVEWIHKTFFQNPFLVQCAKIHKKMRLFWNIFKHCAAKKMHWWVTVKKCWPSSQPLLYSPWEKIGHFSGWSKSENGLLWVSHKRLSVLSLARALTAICLEIGLARTIWCFREKESWKIHDY